MSTTIFLAYLLIAFYFLMERLQRKSEQALSLKVGASDQGSTRLFLVGGLLEIVSLLLAPVFNINGLGCLGNGARINRIGILMMIGGLTLRYLAAKTLGEFYTRTLLVTPEQQVIEQGLYRVVRHPGYLGILIASVGAGLATANWIVIVTIMVTKFLGLGYRIYSEEEMLKAEFGDKYRAYMENTWRLIPFIF